MVMVEIWDRKTCEDESRVVVSVNGSAKSFENYEAGFVYLDGLVKELESASETAKQMYLRERSE